MTKLLTLGILFSTAVRAVVVVTSFILELREALVAKVVISGILSSIVLIWALYTSFLATAFFTASLVYLNQQQPVLTYQYLTYVLYFSNYLH